MIMKVINNTDQDIYLVKDKYIYKGIPTYLQDWEITGQMFRRLKALENVNMISIFYVDEKEVANNASVNISHTESQPKVIETTEPKNAPVTTNFVNTNSSTEIEESITEEQEEVVQEQGNKKKSKKK